MSEQDRDGEQEHDDLNPNILAWVKDLSATQRECSELRTYCDRLRADLAAKDHALVATEKQLKEKTVECTRLQEDLFMLLANVNDIQTLCGVMADTSAKIGRERGMRMAAGADHIARRFAPPQHRAAIPQNFDDETLRKA